MDRPRIGPQRIAPRRLGTGLRLSTLASQVARPLLHQDGRRSNRRRRCRRAGPHDGGCRHFAPRNSVRRSAALPFGPLQSRSYLYI